MVIVTQAAISNGNAHPVARLEPLVPLELTDGVLPPQRSCRIVESVNKNVAAQVFISLPRSEDLGFVIISR
jgi:hypothetical protein